MSVLGLGSVDWIFAVLFVVAYVATPHAERSRTL